MDNTINEKLNNLVIEFSKLNDEDQIKEIEKKIKTIL